MAEQYRTFGRTFSTKLKQEITAISAKKNYDYGTLLEDTMGNKYRYGKLGGSSVLTQRCGWGYNYQITGHIAVPTTSPIGTSIIYATIGGTDGIEADGVIAVDYLKDGYVIVWHADLTIMRYRIRSNTAVATGTMSMVIEGVLNAAVTAGAETLEIFANPWVDVRTGNAGGNHAFIGQPMAPLVTAYPYGWWLTHGPTFIDPQATVGTTHHAKVGFRHDGSIDMYNDSSIWTEHMQYAGYVLSYFATGGQAAPIIMLDLE